MRRLRLQVHAQQKLNLMACIDAMRKVIEATVTAPAPPASDQNKMLPPDHAPPTGLLLQAAAGLLSLLRESIPLYVNKVKGADEWVGRSARAPGRCKKGARDIRVGKARLQGRGE